VKLNGFSILPAWLLMVSFLVAGCATTPPAGGGGGADDGSEGEGEGEGEGENGNDPLPEFQLGDDAQLDADVAAIVAADQQVNSPQCLDLRQSYTAENVMLNLKFGYTQSPDAMETFPEFVASIAELEQPKADEICSTTLENASEGILALVGEATAARNRQRGCEGVDTNVTDEVSLTDLLRVFFNSPVRVYATLEEAEPELAAFVADLDLEADDACGN
jgi:hypothetical protein